MEIRPFLPDPAGLSCEHLEIDQDRVTLDIESLATSAVCPVCGSSSGRMNSRYNPPIGSDNPPAAVPAGPTSTCEPFRQEIVAGLERALSAQRIWQDLVAGSGITSSHDSVKRFVRRLGRSVPLPFRRMKVYVWRPFYLRVITPTVVSATAPENCPSDRG